MILTVDMSKRGANASSSPRPQISALRRRMTGNGMVVRVDSVTDTPTINTKKGKMRSVGVQPCHSACSNGAYT